MYKIMVLVFNKFPISSIVVSYFLGFLTYHVFFTHKSQPITFNRVTIPKCNRLFRQTKDELSIYHPDIKNQTIRLYKRKIILVDDILYGYDLLFERGKKFATSSWLGVQSQQDPSDAILIQMLLWEIKPDLIIDLGN